MIFVSVLVQFTEKQFVILSTVYLKFLRPAVLSIASEHNRSEKVSFVSVCFVERRKCSLFICKFHFSVNKRSRTVKYLKRKSKRLK